MECIIGSTAYRTRAEAISGEVGKWTDETIHDVEDAVCQLRAMAWFDEALGDVEPGEIREGIEAHNAHLRERRATA